MIYSLTKDISSSMKSKGFAFPVVYGPERLDRELLASTAIVVERDRERGDSFFEAQGSQRNPRKLRGRAIGCRAMFFARSPLDGARANEHEELADAMIDAFVSALYKCTAEGRSTLEITSGVSLTPEEFGADPDTWPGVAYDLRFKVGRGIFDFDVQGAGLPEGTFDTVSNTTTVNLFNGAGSEETACGA